MKRLSLWAFLATYASMSSAQSVPSKDGKLPDFDMRFEGNVDQAPRLRMARPVGDMNDWLADDDYARILAAAPEGQRAFGIDVAVSPDDSVTDCRVTSWQGETLTPVVCDIIRKRGRFLHALAPDGSRRAAIIRLGLQTGFRNPGDTPQRAMPPPAPPAPFGWRPLMRPAVVSDPASLTLPASSSDASATDPSM